MILIMIFLLSFPRGKSREIQQSVLEQNVLCRCKLIKFLNDFLFYISKQNIDFKWQEIYTSGLILQNEMLIKRQG